jgi:DNA-binding MarR family transcriptional regulator
MIIDDELKGRFRNEFHKGLINLVYTSNSLNYKFLQFLKKHKLTSQQYNVLKVLRAYNSKPCSIEFLKERMLDKNSDMSRIIDRLYIKKLVERKENRIDRRQKDIEITQKGFELLNNLDESELKVDTLLANLTFEEVNELNRLLDKIRDKK